MELRIDAKAFRGQLAILEGRLDWSARDLQELADLAAYRIVRRTRAGLDYKDKPFRAYSPRYARYRARRGRNTSPVDLTFRGRMLASLRSGVDGDMARLFFDSAEQARIARAHNEGVRTAGGFATTQRYIFNIDMTSPRFGQKRRTRMLLPQRRFLDVAKGTALHSLLAKTAARLLLRKLAN